MARVPFPRVACAVLAAALAVTGVGAEPAHAQEQTTLDVLRVVDGEYTVETVTVPARNAEDAADRLEDEPEVVVADTGVTYEVTAPDPYWDLDGPVEDAQARQAWPRARGTGQIVAVLDTAASISHEDLVGAVLNGTDMIGGTGDPWHGYGVAGVIAARADNGTGGAGMAPDAQIMPVRVCNDGGCTSAAVARGILWAADHGADVINMSLAGPSYSDVTAAAIRYALDKNISVVASTGNQGLDGNPTMYPAANSGVIAVSATDPSGVPAPWAVHGWQADMATVGEGVLVTMPNDGYGEAGGTSFSGPAVAGAAALLRAANPGIAPEDVQAALQAGADSVTWDRAWGAGRLDVPAALAATDRVSASVTVSPAAGRVTVSWPPVAGATGYTVRLDGVVKATVTGTSAGITGLTDGTQVAVDVQASNGARSRPVLATVGAPVAGTPVLHSATVGGSADDAYLTLTMSVPSGSAPRFSLVRDGVTTATYVSSITTAQKSVSVSIGPVSAHQTRWQIRAVDTLGRTSADSNGVVTGSGAPAPPAAVTGLVAQVVEDEVLLTWDDLGPASTYRVTVDGTVVATSRTPGAVVAAPPAGVTWYHEVVAVDAWQQAGPPVGTNVTGVDLGSAPVMTIAPEVIGEPAVGHTVNTPDAFSGADTVEHQWEACDADGCVAVAGDTTHEITAGEIGKRLRVHAAAHNAAGTTTALSALSDVIPAAAPGAPTIGVATAGSTTATVRWFPPIADGGSPITGYTVHAFVGGAPTGTTAANADATSAVVTGLLNGTTYTFSVTAANAYSTGTPSASSSAVTPHADLGARPRGLAIAHRLSNGGMNLWRLPLDEQEAGFGSPAPVRSLSGGGFSYDRSRTLAGAVGDVTGSDDGTPDQIIWHASASGGPLVWAVGGGRDTTPRLWHDLRTGGWSWARSVPMLGDVTGDGWEDLVVRHATAAGDSVVWVFPSDGERLQAPQNWGRAPGLHQRGLLADVDGDGRQDLLTARPASSTGAGLAYDVRTVNAAGTGFAATGSNMFTGFPSAGWSYGSSRQLAGDVTGDGLTDLVTVHASGNGGLLVWVHRSCGAAGNRLCFLPPTRWQDLRTSGWSYGGSRQVLADTDGDGKVDVVSLHSSGATPGLLVWRHRSDGGRLLAPQRVVDLRAGGWNYARLRADGG